MAVFALIYAKLCIIIIMFLTPFPQSLGQLWLNFFFILQGQGNVNLIFSSMMCHFCGMAERGKKKMCKINP